MHRLNFTICILAICLCLLAKTNSCSANEKWTQFRGTDSSGIASESASPPVQWDLKRQIVWEAEVPGVGWSSPVYDAGRIWLTSAITTPATPEQIEKKKQGVEYARIKTVAASVELRVICLELASGKILHDLMMAKIDDPELINPMNSYASPTAAIANGRVIIHFGNYGTWCLDAASGEPLWKKTFVVDHSVGPGSSPIIFNDKVILVCDGIDQQFVVAVNLETGEEAWRTNRPPMRAPSGEQQKAYCTPTLINVNGRDQAIIPTAQWIVSYDPDSGEELWRADHGNGFSVTPMATFESGLVIFSTGYGRTQFVAVDPTGSGDVTETHIRWRARNAPTMPSFIGSGGRIYAIADDGIMVCLDAKTGEVLERKRIGGNFSASPLLAAGNLYLSSREGTVSVIHCSDGLETVATNKFESPILASPAVVGDDLLIRTEKKLYRIKK